MNPLIVRIGRRGQITLPRVLRRQLRLQEGDLVAFIPFGERFLLQPLSKTLLDLRGSVRVEGHQDLDELRRQAIAEHARKVAQNEP
ncbi:MAG: AbrB/MazE/SpoVT family DNA-binding domain-containing protein [Anaerolineae bacterium]|nr:AbrB/MazE/SpoVT family DNA-binding domain-containing protein [Anaerolineae bacterium]